MTKKGNAIFLSCNVEGYVAGNYHQDLIDAVHSKFNCFVYGPEIPNLGTGPYSDYDENDTIEDVIRKSGWKLSEIDLVICGTHWDKPGQNSENKLVDPHPNINLSSVSCRTVYFLNKEYINLDQKLAYARRNEFDIIATVMPEETFRDWDVHPMTKIIQSHFGINMDVFQYSDAQNRKYDLSFTGSLHEQYTNKRRLVKNKLFNYQNFPTNRGPFAFFMPGAVISKEFNHLNIYWAEWSKRWSRGWDGKTLLPSGDAYGKLMRDSTLFFNTLSAAGIFGTRFFEVMASGSINLCPRDNYYNILHDGENCVMYDHPCELKDLIDGLLAHPEKMRRIMENGHQTAQKATYSNRLSELLSL